MMNVKKLILKVVPVIIDEMNKCENFDLYNFLIDETPCANISVYSILYKSFIDAEPFWFCSCSYLCYS